MTKTLVARHEMERIALQEIRSFPGCEYVTDIEIAYQLDRELHTNWTIHVFTREGADMMRIQYSGIDTICARNADPKGHQKKRPQLGQKLGPVSNGRNNADIGMTPI